MRAKGWIRFVIGGLGFGFVVATTLSMAEAGQSVGHCALGALGVATAVVVVLGVAEAIRWDAEG